MVLRGACARRISRHATPSATDESRLDDLSSANAHKLTASRDERIPGSDTKVPLSNAHYDLRNHTGSAR